MNIFIYKGIGFLEQLNKELDLIIYTTSKEDAAYILNISKKEFNKKFKKINNFEYIKNLKLDTIYFSEKKLNEWFEYEHDLIKPKSCSNCINSNLKKGFDFLEKIIEKEIKFFKWKCNNCVDILPIAKARGF